MRHTLCTMLAVFSLSGAYAQKNSILLFGNSTGGHSTSEDNSMKEMTSSFLLNAGIGSQVSPHVTLGLQGGYGRRKSENTTPTQWQTTITSEYGIGVFGRYTSYLGDRFFVYLQGDAGCNAYSQKTEGGSGIETSTPWRRTYGADIFPAVGCFIYKGWAVNLNVGYLSYRYGSIDGRKSNAFSYSIGSFGIGFSKNFEHKAKAKPKE